MNQAPHPGPHAGSLRRFVGKSWLKAFGWTLAEPLPDVPKAVFVAAPHTSNWDLPFSLAVAWSLDINISWAGKSTLFKPPFGPLFRALGGVPIDRQKAGNQAENIAKTITDAERLYLVIAPSGTRKNRDHWKSGFYHIARMAGVPMMLAFLDYEKKKGGIAFTMKPSGDITKDMDRIRAFYADVRGKHPEREATPKLREEDAEKPSR